MKKADEVITDLSHISKRHDAFKKIFNEFQKNTSHIHENQFPVKGISLVEMNDAKSTISFAGRIYEICFSSCMADGTFKGKITAYRVIDGDTSNEVASVTYNGQSLTDMQPPQGEDPIMLNEDSCCINIILNWLHSDINA